MKHHNSWKSAAVTVGVMLLVGTTGGFFQCPANHCDPTQCAASQGCCNDAGDTCILPAQQNTTLCFGSSCGPCGANVCDNGVCTDKCAYGCVDQAGTCRPGTDPMFCGNSLSFYCSSCGSSLCLPNSYGGACSACDLASCPNGCCSPIDGGCILQSDQSNAACGPIGGQACTTCPGTNVQCGLSPDGGTCTTICDNRTCPDGCCDPVSFACVNGPQQDAGLCGSAGSFCGGCDAGVCVVGTYGGTCPMPCGPNNCTNGCCDSLGVCEVASQTNDSCGRYGVSCAPCPSNETCAVSNLGGTCGSPCTPANCPNGCCSDAGACVDQSSQDANNCGVSGACVSCASNGTCVQGMCQLASCDSSICPIGCCENFGGYYQCIPPSQLGGSTLCGEAGGACFTCPTNGLVCQETATGGECMTCSPSSCPNGCCDLDSGYCVPAAQQSALSIDCGAGGQACAPCSSTDYCVVGAAGGVCTTYTCPGGCPYGCCEAGAGCVDGSHQTTGACGLANGYCGACAAGELCLHQADGGSCVTSMCNPTSCGSVGCCLVFSPTNISCAGYGAQSTGNCGSGGEQCEPCAAGQSCEADSTFGGLCN